MLVIPRQENCWLRRNGVFERTPAPACEGSLRRVHLIARQELRRVADRLVLTDQECKLLEWDDRGWVWACGGLTGGGSGGHHGMFDTERSIRVPRNRIPWSTERFARELGLGWYLDLEYGERRGPLMP